MKLDPSRAVAFALVVFLAQGCGRTQQDAPRPSPSAATSPASVGSPSPVTNNATAPRDAGPNEASRGELVAFAPTCSVRAVRDGDTVTVRRFDDSIVGRVTVEGSKGHRFFGVAGDGRALAIADEQQLVLFDVATGGRKWRTAIERGETAYGRPAFSPDGVRLGLPRRSGVSMFDVVDGRVRAPNEPRGVSIAREIVFSPDGTGAVVRCSRSDEDACNHIGFLLDGKAVTPLPGHEDQLMAVRFTDSAIDTMDTKGTVRRFSAVGRPTRRLPGPPRVAKAIDAQAFDVEGDFRRVVVGDGDGRVFVWNAASHRVTLVAPGGRSVACLAIAGQNVRILRVDGSKEELGLDARGAGDSVTLETSK